MNSQSHLIPPFPGTSEWLVLQIVADISCFPQEMGDTWGLFDSLSLSRYGKSSGELSSVMILDPITGNSLEIQNSRHS